VHLLHARVDGESTEGGHERDVCVTAVFDKYTVSLNSSILLLSHLFAYSFQARL
jgi:hypothetical protein